MLKRVMVHVGLQNNTVHTLYHKRQLPRFFSRISRVLFISKALGYGTY